VLFELLAPAVGCHPPRWTAPQHGQGVGVVQPDDHTQRYCFGSGPGQPGGQRRPAPLVPFADLRAVSGAGGARVLVWVSVLRRTLDETGPTSAWALGRRPGRNGGHGDVRRRRTP
jgi:hypothetical protein